MKETGKTCGIFLNLEIKLFVNSVVLRFKRKKTPITTFGFGN